MCSRTHIQLDKGPIPPLMGKEIDTARKEIFLKMSLSPQFVDLNISSQDGYISFHCVMEMFIFSDANWKLAEALEQKR